MSGQTEDKGIAVVIGVSTPQGVGGAVCKRFATEGFDVIAVARNADRLAQTAEQINDGLSDGAGGVSVFQADATDPAAVAALFAHVSSRGKPLALVAYNAGNNMFKPLLDMTPDFFENVWRLCAFGAFLCGQAAARLMVEQGQAGQRKKAGSVIFTGATASMRARPPFTAFASAKAAERALAHGMAREFGKEGIHVAHVVIDGAVDGDKLRTRMSDYLDGLGEDGSLHVDAIADAFWMLHNQHRSAWTLELDLRPYKENF